MSFPTRTNYMQPSGVPGTIASSNPIRSAIAGDGIAFCASDDGVIVAAFGWSDSNGLISNKTSTTTPPTGFIVRDQDAFNTTSVPSASNMTVPPHQMLTVVTGGDFFAVSKTDATIGMSVYASTTDGTISTAQAGSAPSGSVDTGWVVSSNGPAGSSIIISGAVAPPKAVSSSTGN